MAQPQGFKAVKRAILAALHSGDYQHEARDHINVKNLLATGEVSAEDVAGIIRGSDGASYACSRLHADLAIDCHVIRSRGWYVKFYFANPSTIFISVHR
ncbi:hypothetical protein LMG3458_02257 [Achromobacter deleyi]|uniref:Uncharacterized protein n=1 Tax=Achromobacter deleyi TaxID=1353891 RepID=A0A6S6ZVT6_9BURK|nr:hypothetical protein [Achromobacter deleyi]CAB3693466.1 hypothetical protein LMG3458_02257 [Achromobacter deleyi]CAB3864950.1 hypothetical protein LMG3412_02451 [Achromobacter deleyi]CAB3882249.1 hypothetical protein LMG3481_03321 [Achromobacter deleyi]CAB3889542.1 hypothetical protein LMG3482_03721 [Achromobacter deleyi]